MLIVWALLLIALISDADAASPRRPFASRHFSAPLPLLSGHAQHTRLPHSHNSATRTAAHSSPSARAPSARALRGSGRSSPNLFAASSKKKKKETHLYFLRLKPNKAVPAVSTTTPKPTEAPIFIIKSTPHPGEPPVFIVKSTPSPKPPAPWPTKPGHHRPTMRPPRPPTTPPKPQSVHYHWHLQGPPPIVPHGAHHIKYIVKTKPSYPRPRPPPPLRAPPPLRPPPPAQTLRPPPQHMAVRPRPQPFKQPHVHHTHQHLHHHLVPATHIIVRKRPQGPPPPRRRPWGFF